MGINISRHTDPSDNDFLQKFVGKDHIPSTDDEFWNGFLQYQISLPTNRYGFFCCFCFCLGELKLKNELIRVNSKTIICLVRNN